LGRRLGLYEALRTAPASADELARPLRSVAPGRRVAPAHLREPGFVEREGGRYRLSSFAALYLTSGGADSLAPSLDLLAAQASSFDGICRGVRDGTVPPRLDVTRPEGDRIAFLDAVNAYLGWAAVELLRKTELPPIRDFIVGSHGGELQRPPAPPVPQARVTYGCLPELVREIPRLRAIYRCRPSGSSACNDHSGDPSGRSLGPTRPTISCCSPRR